MITFNIYELATEGDDDSVLGGWTSPVVTTNEQFHMLNSAESTHFYLHESDVERRMHMLFVWWATQ